jgi:hypothetical protein
MQFSLRISSSGQMTHLRCHQLHAWHLKPNQQTMCRSHVCFSGSASHPPHQCEPEAAVTVTYNVCHESAPGNLGQVPLKVFGSPWIITITPVTSMLSIYLHHFHIHRPNIYSCILFCMLQAATILPLAFPFYYHQVPGVCEHITMHVRLHNNKI